MQCKRCGSHDVKESEMLWARGVFMCQSCGNRMFGDTTRRVDYWGVPI